MGDMHVDTHPLLGTLLAGTDVEAVLAEGDGRALYALWNTYLHNRINQDAIDKGDPNHSFYRTVQADLATSAPVTPAQALRANRRLIEFLLDRRWEVMHHAREAGDSWTVIGGALEMSKQGAVDWYNRHAEDAAARKAAEQAARDADVAPDAAAAERS